MFLQSHRPKVHILKPESCILVISESANTPKDGSPSPTSYLCSRFPLSLIRPARKYTSNVMIKRPQLVTSVAHPGVSGHVLPLPELWFCVAAGVV